HAYLRVRAHPLDLLARSCEPVEMAGFIDEVNRHDIRLAVARAGQSSDLMVRQKFATLVDLHFANQHVRLAPLILDNWPARQLCARWPWADVLPRQGNRGFGARQE